MHQNCLSFFLFWKIECVIYFTWSCFEVTYWDFILSISNSRGNSLVVCAFPVLQPHSEICWWRIMVETLSRVGSVLVLSPVTSCHSLTSLHYVLYLTSLHPFCTSTTHFFIKGDPVSTRYVELSDKSSKNSDRSSKKLTTFLLKKAW